MSVKRFLDQELKNEDLFLVGEWKFWDVNEKTNKVTKSKKSLIIRIYHMPHVVKIIDDYKFMQCIGWKWDIKMFTRTQKVGKSKKSLFVCVYHEQNMVKIIDAWMYEMLVA